MTGQAVVLVSPVSHEVYHGPALTAFARFQAARLHDLRIFEAHLMGFSFDAGYLPCCRLLSTSPHGDAVSGHCSPNDVINEFVFSYMGYWVFRNALKLNLELEGMSAKVLKGSVRVLPPSWLTIPQLREAEAAFNLLINSPLRLTDCVVHALGTLAGCNPVKTSVAFTEYINFLEARSLEPRHRQMVQYRLRRFLRNVEMVGDINPDTIRTHVFRPGIAAWTRLGEASVIRAFLNFCVKQRWIKSSPFEIDTRELRRRSRRDQDRPLILTPDQCQALLWAAIETDGGNHVPYLVLCLWGGIRPAEVERLTKDDIIFEGDSATVRILPKVAKTASYRDVYLPPNVVPLLKECIDRGIFDSSPIGSPLVDAWVRIRIRAGLIEAKRVGKFRKWDVTYIHWQKNILRHTGLSYYYRKTRSISETARQAGHSADVAFQHYISLAKPEDAKVFYAVRGAFVTSFPAASRLLKYSTPARGVLE